MSKCEQETSICNYISEAIVEAEKKCVDGEQKKNFVIEKIKNIITNSSDLKKNFLGPLFLTNPIVTSIIIKVVIMILNKILSKNWIESIEDLEKHS